MTQVNNVLSQFTEDDVRFSAEAYGYGKRTDEIDELFEALQTDGTWSERGSMKGDEPEFTGTYDYPHLFDEAFNVGIEDEDIDSMPMEQMISLFMGILGLQATAAAPAPFVAQSVIFESASALAEEADPLPSDAENEIDNAIVANKNWGGGLAHERDIEQRVEETTQAMRGKQAQDASEADRLKYDGIVGPRQVVITPTGIIHHTETYFASGCDEDMIEYIAEYHSLSRDDRGFPIVEVSTYFEEGAESWGNDVAELHEEIIKESMEYARDNGFKYVCFND